MLPDLSAAHIFVLVVVALIVVGPKDLPGLLRKIGQFMAKLRGMANEFRASFDEMARQSELDELRKEVNAMRAAAGKPMEDFKNEFEGHLMQPLISTEPDPAPMVTEPPTMEELESGTYLPPEFRPPRGTPPVKSSDVEAPATEVKAAPKAKKAAAAKAPASKAPVAKAKAAPPTKAAAPKTGAPKPAAAAKAPAPAKPKPKPTLKAKPKAAPEPGA